MTKPQNVFDLMNNLEKQKAQEEDDADRERALAKMDKFLDMRDSDMNELMKKENATNSTTSSYSPKIISISRRKINSPNWKELILKG